LTSASNDATRPMLFKNKEHDSKLGHLINSTGSGVRRRVKFLVETPEYDPLYTIRTFNRLISDILGGTYSNLKPLRI
ncbi:574_t:CDS:2, partial [Funneliformis mosseae]